MDARAKTGFSKKYLHVIIMLAFMIGFKYLPPVGGLPELGMEILGIFIGMLWGWSTLGFTLPSILVVLFLGLSDYTTCTAALSKGFGDSTTILIFFLLLFAAAVEECGLSTALANWLLSRKITEGRPWVLSFMFLLAGWLMGCLVSLYASIVLLWSIFLHMCEQVGYKPYEKYPVMMLAGISVMCDIGAAMLPFKGISIIYMRQMNAFAEGFSVNYAQFTAVTAILGFLFIFCFLFFGKYVMKADVSLLRNTDIFAAHRQDKLSHDQRVIGALLILMMVMLFLPSILPKGSALYALVNGFGTYGTPALVVALFLLWNLGGGRYALNKLIYRGVQWDLIFMFVAIANIGGALTSEEGGIMILLKALLEPLYGNLGTIGFIVVSLLIPLIVTQVANNVVVVTVFVPIMCSFMAECGANPYIMTVLGCWILNIAFMTAPASGPAAMIFGHSWVDTKSAYIYGAWVFILTVVLGLGLGIPLAYLIF